MMPKILVFERIHVAGLELMSRFAEVDVCLGLDRTGVLGRVPDADAIVVKSATKVDGALIDRATRLKVVERAGTGTENIDLAYAAAVDVLEPEPPFESPPAETSYDHPLLHHERVLVTPHMAASTEDAQRRIAVELAERLEAHL